MAKKTKQPDPDIEYRGKAITLPADPGKMPLREAIKTLERKAADEETILDVHEVIDAHPHDGLVAFSWAMKEIYGWASPQPVRTFFGDIPPDMITVKTGPKDHEFLQLPCGQFKLPNISEPIRTGLDWRGNSFHVMGQVTKRDKDFLVELVNKARERLRTHSIFQGRAIQLPADDDGDPVFQGVSFIDTDYIRPEELILNDDEYAQVQASLWTPIQNTMACINHQIPLKRGVLLEGPFGTGKTMTANVTSKVCVDNDWTFILLDDVRALKDVLVFAKRYEPCVIFAEDVDRVADQRDQRGNDLLNTIDGALSKNSRIITVLTTNFVDKLDQAMLRPGRLDAVISVKCPEEGAVKRLLRLYGRELIAEDDTLDGAAQALAGSIPATVREAVERAKLGMIHRGDTAVRDADLVTAAHGMKRHLELLNTPKAQISDEEALGKAMKKLMVPVDVEELEAAFSEATGAVYDAVGQVQQSARAISKSMEGGSRMTGKALEAIHDDTKAIRKRVG